MDGFQQRREQKKKDILTAAHRLFMTHGIQKVSVSEIARTAGVSQVTIYNYFENKHTLVYESFLFYVDQAMKDFEATIQSDLPFPEKVKQLIFAKKETASRIHPEYYQYMMKEYTADEGNMIEKVYAEKTMPALARLLEEGRREGFVDPSISQEAILFYLNILKDAMQREEVYERVLPLTEDITKIFFYGIVGRGGE
ncbi:TetR/AcrR family transcriptional regulator [Alteribacter natronophilus]|uniref:TetR/AcrR family transcriptional regulator n=1 Tax=Alteribacter natronophilus TaxID=2583810 RepID=UPI00110F5944|nr:TetR/AcrR family transcriptional regulator [Alteribacter natronophilus]TMW72888.1 TetR/AcrR family transcriptional regulator [Alteribacter natronophilus]